MIATELTPTSVEDLEVFVNPCNLRRDLHVFVDYLQDRTVKRLHRSNSLSKGDATRLAKLMTDPDALEEVQAEEDSQWVDYVDRLALTLGFVSYDTEGIYAGYTSVEPSFPDNYITANTEKYRQYLESSLEEQEHWLLNTLIQKYRDGSNEFYETSVVGKLQGFSSFGSAVGVMPTLNFADIRRFLFNILRGCESGVWYSTASLIQYLKTRHPFFLIPEDPKVSRGGREEGRYANFYESKRSWGNEIKIAESDPDAVERVEGRYVERFLESIPLIMGYVDVAYRREPYKGLFPEMNQLQAFKVNERFLHVMEGKIPAPRVSVQPNFEIHVESELYPAQALSQLTPLAEVVTEDKLIILKLQKQRVLSQLTRVNNLDVIGLLKDLSGRELPQNIRMELEEWAGHSDVFTLYEGVALLEGDEHLPEADPFTLESISPTIRIVRPPDQLFDQLEKAEMVPLWVKHPQSTLSPLPEKARTIFAKGSQVAKPKPKTKEAVILRRETTITLHFQHKGVVALNNEGPLGCHGRSSTLIM